MSEESVHLFVCQDNNIRVCQLFSRRVIVACCDSHSDLSAQIKLFQNLQIVIFLACKRPEGREVNSLASLFDCLEDSHHCHQSLAACSRSGHKKPLAFKYTMFKGHLLRRVKGGISKVSKERFYCRIGDGG